MFHLIFVRPFILDSRIVWCFAKLMDRRYLFHSLRASNEIIGMKKWIFYPNFIVIYKLYQVGSKWINQVVFWFMILTYFFRLIKFPNFQFSTVHSHSLWFSVQKWLFIRPINRVHLQPCRNKSWFSRMASFQFFIFDTIRSTSTTFAIHHH